ncbi:Spt20 family-domain-containing protein [Phycomyces blakesleeanus]
MDVFDEASCRYYEGCLIVEIHDHRSPKKFHTNGQNGSQSDSETQVKRLAMQPTAESLWTDIHLLSEEWGFPWTEQVAVEVEAKILVRTIGKEKKYRRRREKERERERKKDVEFFFAQLATEEPLCLDPSFQVSRISNAMEQWNRVRRSKKKQKWNSLEREQKLAKKAEDVKAMTIMDTVSKSKGLFPITSGKACIK